MVNGNSIGSSMFKGQPMTARGRLRAGERQNDSHGGDVDGSAYVGAVRVQERHLDAINTDSREHDLTM